VRRPPAPTDLLGLVRALAEHDVEYAVIGGTAMALFGFPRATRDIDEMCRDGWNSQSMDPEGFRGA
jgi:hypothetical protein